MMIDKPPLYGDTTKSAIECFNIGKQRFDWDFIETLLNIKLCYMEAAIETNMLSKKQFESIRKSIQFLIKNKPAKQFPLKIWISGSGTQLNININEVIANMANNIDQGAKVHHLDHINMFQSSNDVIPAALKIHTIQNLKQGLLPSLNSVIKTINKKMIEFGHIRKVGHTHLRNAVPMTYGGELSAYYEILKDQMQQIKGTIRKLYLLGLGGTAVGSRTNCPKRIAHLVIKKLSAKYYMPFKQAKNLYVETSNNSALTLLSHQLSQTCESLLKMTRDLVILSSGPNIGFNEISLPHNVKGSSIMPGKQNPTQCESLAMICCHIIGNCHALSLAEMNGHLQLNTMRSLVLINLQESISLLSEGLNSFEKYCLQGLEINRNVVKQGLINNQANITLLAPLIGHEASVKVAKEAKEKKLPIEKVVIQSGLLTPKEIELIQFI